MIVVEHVVAARDGGAHLGRVVRGAKPEIDRLRVVQDEKRGLTRRRYVVARLRLHEPGEHGGRAPARLVEPAVDHRRRRARGDRHWRLRLDRGAEEERSDVTG